MRTYAFIDAANLFYGGEKSLGWKIDYRKLYRYLQNKYDARKVFYFGGVELCGFRYDYQKYETVPLAGLEAHLIGLVKSGLPVSYLKKVRFYRHLERFGFTLFIKPVKTYHHKDGSVDKKANCDVDMTFHLMKEKDNFDRAIILSGDGDFLPVLKHLRDAGKEIFVLARGIRSAVEIRQFATDKFLDFGRLRQELEIS